jgi:serine protease Do
MMRSTIAWVVLVGSLCALDSRAATPAPELQKRVRAATFEVVVPKPADSGVTYERPLPLELLPFSERNDHYWSMGTAFAIAPNTFVTAAHVLAASTNGQGGPPELRAANGETFKLDQVLKFSLHQDFAVFTTVKSPASIALEPNRETTIDEPVFAVGNALGEGVVIRDGLLTSLTPEDQDGRWKWLRYSAATSPGNSGGPLLNVRGQVIGVVIGKSPGENLNYALPIEHVMSAGNVAVADTRFPLRVPVLRDTFSATYQATFALPLPLAEFVTRLQAKTVDVYREQLRKFLSRSEAELFPRGRSAKVLAGVERAYCPLILMQAEDRTWEVDGAQGEVADLPDDGQVWKRESAEYTLFNIDRGKALGDAKFYADSRAAMDLLLKGLKFPRRVGSETILVTSLGPAISDTEHLDRYQRHWRLRVWNIPYLDAQIISLYLPTPDGYAGIAQFGLRGGLDLAVEQLKFLADYVYVSYSGTLAQWRAFLARRDALPLALTNVTFERDTAGTVRFRSPRFDFDLPAAALKTADESPIQMQMTFGEAAGKPTWEIGAVYVNKDDDGKTFVGAVRQPKPGKDAGKEATGRWEDMLGGKGDFSGVRGHDSDYKKTWRRSAVNSLTKPAAPPDPTSQVLYEIVSMLGDSKLPRDVDDIHDRLLENLRVKEH